MSTTIIIKKVSKNLNKIRCLEKKLEDSNRKVDELYTGCCKMYEEKNEEKNEFEKKLEEMSEEKNEY